MADKLIPVLPKNYRKIALYAIQVARNPVVVMDRKQVSDFSEAWPLTQRGIRHCRNFEVRDGSTPILGFHDHPDQMWVAGQYIHIAQHCADKGWLKIQRRSA